jgi:lipopolysaccharide assembly protein A
MTEEQLIPGPVSQEDGQPAPGQQPQIPQQAPEIPQQAPEMPHHVVKRTRFGSMWLASASFAVVVLLLLIFILENGKSVDVAYFGAHGHLPLGVALLLAAVLGILMVVIPGTARIIQLRLTARRHRRADTRRLAASLPQSQASQASQTSQAPPSS